MQNCIQTMKNRQNILWISLWITLPFLWITRPNLWITFLAKKKLSTRKPTYPHFIHRVIHRQKSFI